MLCLLFYEGDSQKGTFNVNINEASFQDGNYIYEDTTTMLESTTTTTIVFVIDNGKLVKISYTSTGSSINGEYTAPTPV